MLLPPLDYKIAKEKRKHLRLLLPLGLDAELDGLELALGEPFSSLIHSIAPQLMLQ